MGRFKVLLAASLILVSGALVSSCGSETSAPAPRVEPVAPPPTPTYNGTENGRACSITFHREYQLDGKPGVENYRLEASTSYQHGGDGLGKVTLSLVVDRTALQYTDASTDQFLRIALKQPANSAANPTSFRVRWLHGDHHHDNTCTNLQPASR